MTFSPEHKRTRSKGGEAWQHLYSSKRWRTLRRNFLLRHPMCQCPHCSGGAPLQANVVDHIKRHDGDLRLFFALSNLRAMNKECHDRWKQSEEAGGHGFMKGNNVSGEPLSREHDWWRSNNGRTKDQI